MIAQDHRPPVLPVIIYYTVSPVHVRNVQLLKPHLEGWTVRIAYETASPWLHQGSAGELEMVGFAPNDLPEVMWRGEVGAVVFSAIQPRPGPIALLAAALEKGIPTVAIEESNQIALNQGRINNYVLPVDRVLTASEYERRGMVEAGLPERRFEAVGWPFYGGRTGEVADEEKKSNKEALGLDPGRPVAALTLTGLHDAGESPAVRRRQLLLAAEGLPEEYQLVIKPHPIERSETLMPFVEECAPSAVALKGTTPVEDLLIAADVLLNRGASQVCFEALLLKIPVVVLDTGIWTPFHAVEMRVAKDSEALRRIVGELEGDEDRLVPYDEFFRQHLPLTPDRAQVAVGARIAEIAAGVERDANGEEQILELALYQAWAGDQAGAHRQLDRLGKGASDLPADALRRLCGSEAGLGDLEALKAHFGSGFHAHLLRSLWIDQLVAEKRSPTVEDRQWLEGFPPDLQPVWFMGRVRSWVFLLARSGMGEEARNRADKMARDYEHVPGSAKLKRDVHRYLKGFFGRWRVAAEERAVALLGWIRDRVRA